MAGGRYAHCFLIQPYYTPFFTKIQAFCKKTDGFVDYDNIYVNFVMLTPRIFEHLFLPFSTKKTISSGMQVLQSLNIDLCIHSCIFTIKGKLNLPFSFSCFFFHLRLLRCVFPCFSELRSKPASAAPPATSSAGSHIDSIPPPKSRNATRKSVHR